MNFLELLLLLEKAIGHHQIPVNPKSAELRGLIDSGAIHYELITQIATAIYTGNRCRHLHDPVTQDATFESLEPIRLSVLRSPSTDVDVHGLMETICAEVALAFGVITPDDTTNTSSTAGQLKRFRRRLKFL